jgi:hypothetical protein
MKTEVIRLGHSPLTDNVYAGRLNKKESQWLEKKDVTNDFLTCVLGRWENKVEVLSQGESQWEITVRKIK